MNDTSGDARWDDLGADLDGQALGYAAAEDRAQAGDLARGALADLRLVDRLRDAVGADVVFAVRGAGGVRGALRATAPTWVQVVDGPREHVVALAAVLSVTGLGSGATAAPASALESRWTLGHVLRRHSRDRATVRLVLDTGDVLTGTIDAVGADHVELAEHPAGEPRRRSSVLARRVVPFAVLAVVSRDRGAG